MDQASKATDYSPDLSVQLGPLRLKNPVMVASGTFGYGEEYADFIDLKQLGAVVVKGISLQPRPGNPPPRLVETPSGLINAIGLENVGVEAFLKAKAALPEGPAGAGDRKYLGEHPRRICRTGLASGWG